MTTSTRPFLGDLAFLRKYPSSLYMSKPKISGRIPVFLPAIVCHWALNIEQKKFVGSVVKQHLLVFAWSIFSSSSGKFNIQFKEAFTTEFPGLSSKWVELENSESSEFFQIASDWLQCQIHYAWWFGTRILKFLQYFCWRLLCSLKKTLKHAKFRCLGIVWETFYLKSKSELDLHFCLIISPEETLYFGTCRSKEFGTKLGYKSPRQGRCIKIQCTQGSYLKAWSSCKNNGQDWQFLL